LKLAQAFLQFNYGTQHTISKTGVIITEKDNV